MVGGSELWIPLLLFDFVVVGDAPHRAMSPITMMTGITSQISQRMFLGSRFMSFRQRRTLTDPGQSRKDEVDTRAHRTQGPASCM